VDPIIRHLSPGTVLSLGDQVACLPGQIVSKTLAQNDALSLTLFAFDQGEEIATHTSRGDALVTVLSGTGRITLDGVDHGLHAGQSILMPAQIPHAVFAPEPFTMALLQVFAAPEDTP